VKRPLQPLGESKLDNDGRVNKFKKGELPTSKIQVNSMNLEITLKPLYFPENETTMEYSEWVEKQAEFERSLLTDDEQQNKSFVSNVSQQESVQTFMSPGSIASSQGTADTSFYSCRQIDTPTQKQLRNASSSSSIRSAIESRDESGFFVTDRSDESTPKVSNGKAVNKTGSGGTVSQKISPDVAFYYTGGNRKGDALVHIKTKPHKK